MLASVLELRAQGGEGAQVGWESVDVEAQVLVLGGLVVLPARNSLQPQHNLPGSSTISVTRGTPLCRLHSWAWCQRIDRSTPAGVQGAWEDQDQERLRPRIGLPT